MDIKGTVAIVTGSSSVTGVGAETAKALAKRGAKVVVNYSTNKEGALETAELCRSLGGDAIVVQGNVAKDEDCRRIVAETIAKWNRLDILVNNAAVTKTIKHTDLEALDTAEFNRVLSVNLVGNYQMTRAAAPHLKASGDAAVVTVSSTAAFRCAGSSIAYGASKGAVNTMTVGLARALAPVRVNAVCPGGLLGNWTKKILTEEGYKKRVAEAKSAFPLGHAIWPEDVAKVVMFLIADATCMTGELIRMDCGQHLGRQSSGM